MITKDIRALIERLNDHLTVALQEGAGLALGHTHFKLYPDHILIKLLEDGSGDLPCILKHFGIATDEVLQQLNRQLKRFKSGNEDIPKYSVDLMELLESAWLVSSIHLGHLRIRSGALVEPFLEDSRFKSEPFGELVASIDASALRKDFRSIVAGSAENFDSKPAAEKPVSTEAAAKGTSALDQYTIDLTERARSGDIDPISGRDDEIRQTMDILSRRRKNNPILVGEAGVGKTAVVEGLAQRIAAGDVIDSLKDTEIKGLDLGLLQAGASVKGEFEKRLKQVINEVVAAGGRIILFIDEAHTLIGAGGAAGVGDAANLLKPALARGHLRTIGATTFSEYKKYIEKDPALERRFQMVKVDEPDEATACTMLRGIKKAYEEHHKVTITDAAVRSAVSLSKRYIAGRQLPDKAVDVLDTAAARVNLMAAGLPAPLDGLERRKKYVQQRIAAMKADVEAGFTRDESDIADAERELKQIEDRIAQVNMQWQEQQQAAEQIKQLLAAPASEGDGQRQKLIEARTRLAELQIKEPLVLVDVDGGVVASVVADWTGIPIGQVFKDEAAALLDYEKTLGKQIIGQDEALAEIGDSIRVTKSGMGKQDNPIGVFLFVGPSGVGKTETARLTAQVLLGDERFMTTINMSEYQEKHTVSQLKGSPPGYVGYGEGGVLTEAVRRRPYSLVLLDEVEKAHRDVMNLFYQVFDKGFMRDGEGREIDFKNTIIMMTANIGSEILMQALEAETRPSPEDLLVSIRPALHQYFQAALLARMKIVPFYPLGPESIKQIARLKLNAMSRRLQAAHRIKVTYEDALIQAIADKCTLAETGARNVDYIIQRSLLPDISRALVAKMVEDKLPRGLQLSIAKDGSFTYQFE